KSLAPFTIIRTPMEIPAARRRIPIAMLPPPVWPMVLKTFSFIKTTPLYFLLCTIFRIICINRCFHCVVDNHFSLAWLVVQIFDHFFHRNDRICRESVSLLNLFHRALGSFSVFHAFMLDNQTLYLHIY